MKNYSQNDEQRVILEYFGDNTGIFLDLGANDGVTLSNTYALLEKGWGGCYVEASPKAYERLKNNIRPFSSTGLVRSFNVAISNKVGKMIFNESGPQLGKDDVSLVSTFHQHEMDRFKKIVKYEQIEVQCVTYNELFAYSGDFDFISMDIEGSELEVLPQMDLSEVKMFCIEWNSRPDLKKAYDPYFEGFKLIHTTPENLIYAR